MNFLEETLQYVLSNKGDHQAIDFKFCNVLVSSGHQNREDINEQFGIAFFDHSYLDIKTFSAFNHFSWTKKIAHPISHFLCPLTYFEALQVLNDLEEMSKASLFL